MAATVVSVVIFLCGVLVGRGVRAERVAIADVSPQSRPRLLQNSAQRAASDAAAPTAAQVPGADNGCADRLRPMTIQQTGRARKPRMPPASRG